MVKKIYTVALIITLGIGCVACTKKQDEGVQIITAQDTGRDTTKNEQVTGDSAGIADSDVEATDIETTDENEESIEKVEFSSSKEIALLGEWKISNGDKLVLDNGYNLVLVRGGYEYIGSYTIDYQNSVLKLTIWNNEAKEEWETYDDDGNEQEEKYEYNYYVTSYEKYTINMVSEKQMELISEDESKVTCDLVKEIKEDKTVKRSSDRKKEFDAEQKEKYYEALSEYTGIDIEELKMVDNMTEEEYEAYIEEKRTSPDGVIVVEEEEP